MSRGQFRLFFTLALFAVFVILLTSGLRSQKAEATGLTHKTFVEDSLVRAQYLNYCAGCHGEYLQRFDRSDWIVAETDEAAYNSIKYGREEMGMPAFKETFSDAEIRDLARYIREEIPEDSPDRKPAFHAQEVIRSQRQRFILDTVVSGLHVPWGMAFLPNGDMLISERSGTLYRFSKGKLTAMTGLPDIMAKGQGGLLDLRLHPDYENNGWLYFAFSRPDPKKTKVGCTAVMRAKILGNRLVQKELLFDGEPDSNRGHHWGCKLQFDKEGYLWFGIGDRGNRDENPQTLTNDCGKIHRIHDDGRIPKDNPFVDNPEAQPTIYSYGHRNPQGTTMHPETGEIWITEHGPKGGDELNLILPGRNYGWPVISYGINYDGTTFTELTHKEGMEQPITYWDPSIAPCGMTFVTSDRYKGWKNHMLIGSLRFKYLHRLVLDGYEVKEQERLLENIGRVRNVEIGPEGFIYVAMEKPGFIVKLLPVN